MPQTENHGMTPEKRAERLANDLLNRVEFMSTIVGAKKKWTALILKQFNEIISEERKAFEGRKKCVGIDPVTGEDLYCHH